MTTTLRVIVVDDELPARRRLCRLLSAMPDITVVGQAGDGSAALALSRELQPDVMLIDIQMPAPGGIEVVRQLPEPRPHVIFVTAFDRFAVRAFELQALDYLLKPVTATRLAEAISRVRKGAPSPAGLQRIAVKRAGRVDLVGTETIEWIEAADNYVVIHTTAGKHVLRETLTGLATVLDPGRFQRIHRSAIVAVAHVRQLAPAEHGDWTAHLHSGARIPVSRKYRRALFKCFDPASARRDCGS
jgi:two-component system, LytTR family, response regulator